MSDRRRLTDDDIASRLGCLSLSRSYQRKLRAILEKELSFDACAKVDASVLIGAILLVEMHERPGPVRAVEWLVSLLVPRAVRSPLTRGPLQIADGPWHFADAIDIAHHVLGIAVRDATTHATAIRHASACWSGAANRQPGSMYGYSEVLRESYLIAHRGLTKLRLASGA